MYSSVRTCEISSFEPFPQCDDFPGRRILEEESLRRLLLVHLVLKISEGTLQHELGSLMLLMLLAREHRDSARAAHERIRFRHGLTAPVASLHRCTGLDHRSTTFLRPSMCTARAHLRCTRRMSRGCSCRGVRARAPAHRRCRHPNQILMFLSLFLTFSVFSTLTRIHVHVRSRLRPLPRSNHESRVLL